MPPSRLSQPESRPDIVELRFDVDHGAFGDAPVITAHVVQASGREYSMIGLTPEEAQRLADGYHDAIYGGTHDYGGPQWTGRTFPSNRTVINKLPQYVIEKVQLIPPPSQEEPMADTDMLRAEAQSVLSRLADATALEKRFPNQPLDGAIIKWIVTSGSGRNRTEYIYIALRVEDNWYLTGANGGRVLGWEALKREIGNKPCWLVTEYKEIPQPKKAAADSIENPAEWWAMVYGDQAALDAAPAAEA